MVAATILLLPVEHSLGAEVAHVAHRLHFGDEPVGELVPPVEGHPPLVARSEPLLEGLRNVILRQFVVTLWLENGRVRIVYDSSHDLANGQFLGVESFFTQVILEMVLSIESECTLWLNMIWHWTFCYSV